jgi:ribosomal protein S12 methylthiotransferase accessory factor
MPDNVAIVGQGLLAGAIRAALPSGSVATRTYAAVGDADLCDAALLVTASDGWDCASHGRIQELCLANRLSWLPVWVELGRVVIGPLYTDGTAGCVSCAELRRSVADDHFAVRRSVRESHPRLADRPSPWLTELTARTVGALVADEVVAARSRMGRTVCALVYVDLETLAVSTHTFLPDPLCPTCGAAPADDADRARIELQPQRKPAPDIYRIRRLGAEDITALRETYVDEQTGLIQRVHTFGSGSLAVGVAAMRTRWHDRVELSWGRTLRYGTSEIVAMLESLERLGGMAPGGRRSVVRASFRDVQDTALDPRRLGLYPADRYARPGFHFQPFDAERECRWVWGYSWARQAPILVPAAYAYYRSHAVDRDDPSFAFEISNGCALGGCLEEAIVYGLLELIERDAFLLTWYARLPAAPIDLASAHDRSIPMLAGAITEQTGYRVMAFDTTMEHKVPSVWAMALAPPGTGRPALACSAGAHFDPEDAVGGALRELGPILTDLIGRYPDVAERAAAMTADDQLVSNMDDHSVLYSNAEAAGRLDFLTRVAPSRSFADIRSRCGTEDSFRNADLTDDLVEMVRRLRCHGLDVVVVDQTTPEHRAGDFSCVKVIVPGLLPMTFGHDNRRTHGLPRLFDVPRLLGYREHALPAQDINSYPHPFP